MSHDPRALPPVRAALDALAERDAVRRLHERDTSVFSADPTVQDAVGDRLGWLDCVPPPPEWLPRLRALADDVADAPLDEVILLGMGGSSLAPEVLARVLGPGPRGLPLTVCDSTHPEAAAALDRDLSRALVIVASKSGTTAETAALGALAAERVPDPSHLVAITDPGTVLAAQARDEGWREVFLNPADIGGRFAALSLVGMVPAALLDAGPETLWASAGRLAQASAPGRELPEDPSAVLGAFMAGLAREGRDKLTLLTHPRLASLGDWVEQLVAESTGKHGQGVVPVVGEPVGPPEAYGADRAVVEVRLGGEPVEGVAALAEAGIPVLTVDVAGTDELGAAFLQWELATAYAGMLLEVNPFDEPDVNASKANTKALLAELSTPEAIGEPEDVDPTEALASLRPGDYLALQAYLPQDEATVAALTDLRAALRDQLGVATTLGFGPRFLHSTGQLHKGGPSTVVVLRLADAPTGGPPIPGQAYDFATLVRAQAAGDLQALRDRGRRVAPVRADDLEAACQRIRAALAAVDPPPHDAADTP